MSSDKEIQGICRKGNVIDLAVGVIIGTGIWKIVCLLVDDIIMPPVGVCLMALISSKMTLVLKEAVGDKPAFVIQIWSFS